MKTTPHIHWFVRACLAVFASFIIVLHKRWYLIGEALVSPTFYLAVFISFVIAIFFLWLVQCGNSLLNKYFPWHRGRYLRLFYQIAFCIVLPAALDILFIAIYLNAMGNMHLFNDFLNIDFPVVVAMLALVNIIYISPLLQHEPTKVERQKATQQEQQPTAQSDILIIDHGGTYLHLRVDNDVLCLFKEGRYITVLTLTGDEYCLPDTLSALQERYQHTRLCRINRSAFINARYIIGYRMGDTPRTLEVVIEPMYRQLVSEQRKEFLAVTGEHIPVIRHLFREQE